MGVTTPVDGKENEKAIAVPQGESAQAAVEEPPPPTKPIMVCKVARDSLTATLLLQRSGPNTVPPLKQDLMDELSKEKVTFGINEILLDDLCANPVYNREFTIAQGHPPVVGRDGALNYLVETHRILRPKILEDDTADYRDLGFLQNVAVDQPLCEIRYAEKGKDGMDVHGKVLDGKYGRNPMNPSGTGTRFNADKTMLLAAVDGNVDVKHGKININEVLTVSGGVDFSTGSLEFPGDIIVYGDVLSGFVIKSGGSIVIRGIVEGAHLDAQSDIVISEGVNGMRRGTISAGGNVKCRHIQSCYVNTVGNVYADTIMYCVIECSGNLELAGKRAVLIGGRNSITGRLYAKTIGTSSHVATVINMCSTGIEKSHLIARLGGQIKQLDDEIRKLMQIMAHYDDLLQKKRAIPEHKKVMATVKENYVQFTQQRKEAYEQLTQIKTDMLITSQAKSYIECKKRIHTGVRISFGAANMNVEASFAHSRVHVLDGEIKVSAL